MRVLVGYATANGSTKGVALAIAERLRVAGLDVDALAVNARQFEEAVARRLGALHAEFDGGGFLGIVPDERMNAEFHGIGSWIGG